MRVKELYSQEDMNWGLGDYMPMLEDFADMVIKVDDDDYQGDSFVLYEDNGRYGYLTFGWGSCSGCDALQACETWEEVQELYDHLQNSIKWFANGKQALKWFKEHDWEGDWHSDTRDTFVDLAIKILTEFES